MSKENGFVPIRRGLWEHLRDGRMSPFEALAFIYICSQADTRTGVWKGSAGALVTELGFIPRTARDLLERMEHGGYIRRFVSQGMRRCYPILIHKFPVTQGEHNGEVLDALSSTKQDGCLDLRYISREVHGEVDGEVHGEVHASQRRNENREEREEERRISAAAFLAIGFEKPFGHPKFKSIWLGKFKGRGEWLTEVMEDTIQECQGQGVGVPPQFYEAKHEVEAKEAAEFDRKHQRVPL